MPLEIVQTPKKAAFLFEGFSEFLVVPTDGRKHAVNPEPTWRGDAVGWYEGDTLVVDSTAFNDMLDNMSHGAHIAMLGIPPEPTMMDWNKVIFNMLTIKGIYGREMYETWYKMTVMIQSGLDIDPVITHRFHYTDFQKGFDAMRSGNSGKVVLTWKEE